MQSSVDSSFGPQKATSERRSSRNRNRRGSIPDIKEPSTEVKEKLCNMRKSSSSSADHAQQPLFWEENFVQYLKQQRSSSTSNLRTDSASVVCQGLPYWSRSSSSSSLEDRFYLASRLSQTPSDERPLTPFPSANPRGVNFLRNRCVSAPDLRVRRRKLVEPRRNTFSSIDLVSGLNTGRQGRSAEIVLQFANGWS